MKNILQNLKLITLAIIFSFGLSYVYAWTAPTQAPPGGNTSAPLNTSATDQYKGGGAGTTGGLGIEGLIRGYTNAIFDGSVGIGTTDVSAAKFTVVGTVKITGGVPGGGKVLTSDASGLASWETTGGSSGVPSGTVIMFAGATMPAGYLLCNGSTVSRATYSALFTAIGTTWGAGDGSTTFNLPNLNNRVPLGAGTRVLSTTGGAETHTLTTAEMPAHSHTSIAASGATGNEGVHGAVAIHSGNPTLSTGSSGGNGAHNNMQPFTAINFIIKI